MKNVDLIVYHGGCPDGFCSAYVAKHKFPKAVLMPMNHGQPAPFKDVMGKDVLVVDFSWDRPTCKNLAAASKSFHIFDHHKTAEMALEGLAFATFDMDRSGAALTWDILFPGEPRPWYVNYVQDRDLWRFELPESKSVSAYIMALPHTMDAWNTLATILPEFAASLGAAIRMHIEHYVAGVVEHRLMGKLFGHSAAIVNAPYLNCSDVCEALCEYAEIGIAWFERSDGKIQFSLRSSKESIDVSAIAKNFGGGGHQHAAGFQVRFNEGRTVLDTMLSRHVYD